MIKTLAAAAALTAGAVLAADPGAIEVVAGNFGTGEFTLRVPASEKPLELYWAAAWADDTDEYSQWRAPVFLQDVPAGTTEVTVTVPGFNPDAASRFFLADPDNATVTRPVTLAGGKDGSGNYKSAFITGLHPNWDWRYELVFDVPEFKSNQAWLLCHRNNFDNQNSLLHFIVRGSNDERLRFGYGTQHSIFSTPKAVLDVKYQAAINKNVCVVSNLTDNAFFCTLSANTPGQNYGEYNLWFGASSGAGGKDYSTNDGCTFARVYSFKAWNGSGELVGDFRPMVTNGVAGYFDLVTRKFFESGDQSLAASGTAVASGFEPYVASAETQHVDSLVAHLGALAAVSPALKTGPVECVSGSLPFAIGGIPLYGKRSVNVGDSVTFSVPTENFIWWNESTRTSYRVVSTGLRIDTYDANNDEFVIGTPQPGLRSYTFTRNSLLDGVRVVCLWDAEMLVDPPNGLRAECLRLVDVATNANGKTEVGHGPFNTGVHPVPATTRVFADVYLDSDNRTAQNNLSPVNERRFFGCRDESALSQAGKWQYNFQLTRENVTPPTLRVDMCNYMDGAVSQTQHFNINNTARFEIDLKPTTVRFYDVLQGATHLAEMKDTGYERSSEPLIGTLHIFGQQRLPDTTAPLCVDYNNTRYYTYAVWTDGVNLSRDYAPCIDAAGKPAFYDRVARNYIYPIGDKAEFVAEFTGNVGTNSVYVTGENEKGEPAAYLDPDATALGYHQIADGSSETFAATGRMAFDRRVVGYRVDTWTDGTGWVKGPMCKGRSVTLEGEKTFRRLVWIWDSVTGFVLYVK